MVTPYAGVWIEITSSKTEVTKVSVTPYAGVWIEIMIIQKHILGVFVTPYAGVWIEITNPEPTLDSGESLPTRECGLKL